MQEMSGFHGSLVLPLLLARPVLQLNLQPKVLELPLLVVAMLGSAPGKDPLPRMVSGCVETLALRPSVDSLVLSTHHPARIRMVETSDNQH